MSGWDVKEAVLLRKLDNGTVVRGGDEGLLFVTLVSTLTGQEESGTVCDDHNFNMQATVLFCRSMGHQIDEGLWGRHAGDTYVSR